MTRKQNQNKTGEEKKKTRVSSLMFVEEDDPDIIDYANEIVRIQKAKTVLSVIRPIVREALRTAKEKLLSEQPG